MHYMRWWRNAPSVPITEPLPPATDSENFWSLVDKSGDCWLWTGMVSKGYGRFAHGQTRTYVHRWAYTELVGPIPDGMTLDHLCLEKLCVNPDHLEVVTRSENIRRSNAQRKRAKDANRPIR